MVTVVTTMRLLTVAGMRQCVLPSSCPTVVGSWNRKYPFRICVNFLICISRRRHIMVVSRITEMVTVVTKMRLLTVAGMRQCVLPNSCQTVVGSWNRKYPFRICVKFQICVSRHRHIMVVSSTSASIIRKSPWVPDSLVGTDTFGSRAETVRSSVDSVALCSRRFLPTSRLSRSMATVP
jgi:hypothetical protein